MLILISNQFSVAITVIIILAILVSCGLSRVYGHDPGHAPVLCTKFTPARPAGVGPPRPPPPYPLVVETPV